MTSPSISLTEQMLRRRPVIETPVAHGASDHLYPITPMLSGAACAYMLANLEVVAPPGEAR